MNNSPYYDARRERGNPLVWWGIAMLIIFGLAVFDQVRQNEADPIPCNYQLPTLPEEQ